MPRRDLQALTADELELGMHVAAMTPGELAHWVAEKFQVLTADELELDLHVAAMTPGELAHWVAEKIG